MHHDFEFAHDSPESFRTVAKLFRRDRRLLRRCRILLGDLVKLGHGAIDLTNTLRLLLAGNSNLADTDGDIIHALGQSLKNLAASTRDDSASLDLLTTDFHQSVDPALCLTHDALDFLNTTFQHLADFNSSIAAHLSKIAYFLGDDCKSFSMLSRTSGLYGCVEREQLGLENNIVNNFGFPANLIDHFDDLFDLAISVLNLRGCFRAASINGFNRIDHFLEHFTPLLSLGTAALRYFLRSLGVFRVLLNHRADLVNRAHRLLKSSCLLR